MGYSYTEALVAVKANDAMGALALENTPDASGSLHSVYEIMSDDSEGDSGSSYGFSDAPTTITRDAQGFPSFDGDGTAKKSWAVARGAVRAGMINPGGHGQNRTLAAKYMLEALDPRHRVGNMLAVMLKIYIVKANPRIADRLSLFFDWLDMLSTDAPEVIYSTFAKNNLRSVNQFIQAGVKYVGAGQRGDYRIHIKDGLLYQGKRPFDSRDHSTVFSGPGWAIFVMSPSGQLYAGTHRTGKFHHSSFLAGQPVMSAGEIKVERGVVQIITGKSGHYQPTTEQLIAGVRELMRRGAQMEAARIRLFNRKDEQLVPVKFYFATPGVFKKLTAWEG